MYSILSYFFSKFLIELPHLVLSPMIFSLICYFGCGLTVTANQFWCFVFTLIMVVFDAHSYGYFLSSMFDSSILAAQVSPLFAIPMMLVGGMLCNTGTMSSWVSWLQYLSPIRYGYEALVWNQYEDLDVSPDPLNYLNFDIGMENCWKYMFILGICLRVLTLGFLKWKIRKPIWMAHIYIRLLIGLYSS